MIALIFLGFNLVIGVIFGFLLHYKYPLISPKQVYIYRLSTFLLTIVIFLIGRFLIIFLRNLLKSRTFLWLVVMLPSVIITLIGAYMCVMAGSGKEMLLFEIISIYYIVRHTGILKKIEK